MVFLQVCTIFLVAICFDLKHFQVESAESYTAVTANAGISVDIEVIYNQMDLISYTIMSYDSTSCFS